MLVPAGLRPLSSHWNFVLGSADYLPRSLGSSRSMQAYPFHVPTQVILMHNYHTHACVDPHVHTHTPNTQCVTPAPSAYISIFTLTPTQTHLYPIHNYHTYACSTDYTPHTHTLHTHRHTHHTLVTYPHPNTCIYTHCAGSHSTCTLQYTTTQS